MGHTKASQLCTQFCAKMTTCVNASQYPYYISVTTDHRSTAVIMVAATTYSATSETLLISRRMARSSTTTTRAITTEYWWHSSAIFKFKIVLGTASVVTFVPMLDILLLTWWSENDGETDRGVSWVVPQLVWAQYCFRFTAGPEQNVKGEGYSALSLSRYFQFYIIATILLFKSSV